MTTVEELKKVEPILEDVAVRIVDGRAFSCWGWTVHIARTKTVPVPPKPEDAQKVESI